MACTYKSHLQGICQKHCKCNDCRKVQDPVAEKLRERVLEKHSEDLVNYDRENVIYGLKPKFTCHACSDTTVCPTCQHQHTLEWRYSWTRYDGGCLGFYMDGISQSYCYM